MSFRITNDSSKRFWSIGFLIALGFQSIAVSQTPQELIDQQVPEARKRIEAYLGESKGQSDRTLHIVYWTPSDREPGKGYQERLDRVLSHVQEFYAKEMGRLGFGRSTFALDKSDGGKLKIHVVKSSSPYAQFNVESGSVIRRECLPALRKAGIDVDRETIVIFCNMSNWDEENRKMNQNSPYYAGGGLNGGTAWQVDSVLLDSDLLVDKESMLTDGQYGRISVGRYNSIFVGGVCHELGHALGLPHNRERKDEKEVFGTALMGSGNRTYGEELRSEGRGTFLTLGEGLRLASHPLFVRSDRGLAGRREATIEDPRLTPSEDGKSFKVSGRVIASPECYAILAYMDPAGGGDYDATTMTIVPASNGEFEMDCKALKPGAEGELRLIACTVGGGSIGDLTLSIPYSVAQDGRVDLGAFELRRHLAPIVKGLKSNAFDEAKLALEELKKESSDQKLIDVAESLVGSFQTPTVTPAEFSGETAYLSDLKPEAVKIGYGRPMFNRLPNEHLVLSAGNEIFAKGIYAHAVSEHEYLLAGKWKSFSGVAALADGSSGSCQFMVLGDGKELWRSSVLKEGKRANFDLSVQGIEKLILVVEDAGDGKRSDWGVWLNPKLVK